MSTATQYNDASVVKKGQQTLGQSISTGIWSQLRSTLVLAPIVLFLRQQPKSIIHITAYVAVTIFAIPVIGAIIYSFSTPPREKKTKKIAPKSPPVEKPVVEKPVVEKPVAPPKPATVEKKETPLGPKVKAMLDKCFRGALTNAQFVDMIKATIKPHNYDTEKTIVATSLCCDEVNRPLDNALSEAFGHNFSMGGLAGFPFGGVTSFGAMAHHIPTDGSCVVVFGPHVGIDSEGNVGKINRRGRNASGACCGSAVAACGFVCGSGAKAPDANADPLDAQQGYVSSLLMPHAPRLLEVSGNERQAELPYLMYKSQKTLMDRIVAAGCGEVGGNGKITVIGGIQINTPGDSTDYFLPLSVEVRTNKGELITSPVQSMLSKCFPGALTNAQLIKKITDSLKPFNYDTEKTLVATSLCCDEVNRPLDNALSEAFGHNFSMGGLAGFPFGGVTSFGAMAHHIPTDGSCVVVFGPHVGIDSEGNVGKINRRGRNASGACCGSAVAACGFVCGSGAKAPDANADPLDAQQGYVSSLLMPHAPRLLEVSGNKRQAELPYLMYKSQKTLMDRIVAAGCGEVGGNGKIALLGGIQINTPGDETDYFLPLSFEVKSNKGELLKKIL